jgi:uncharacterized membrane protein HdeD (DUF308 family)
MALSIVRREISFGGGQCIHQNKQPINLTNMQTTIFRKWWMILVQGVLLIIIAFIFFNNPVSVLTVISMWIGILTLAAGALGLIANLTVKNEQRDNSTLLWSIITLLLGILMVAKIGLTMKAITVIFGLWILITGIVLLFAGIEHRKTGALGWIMLLGGVLSIIAGFVIIFDMATGAAWISTLLGIQALIAGIGFILLAFIKRNLVNKIKNSFA